LIKSEKEKLTLEEFRLILDKFPKLRMVTLQGTGETFMNAEVFDMMEAGSRRGIRFTVTSNGTLFTERNVLKIRNLDTAVISVDSPYPEKYKKIRGGNLGLVQENLRRLKKHFPELHLYIQTVVMDENMDDLPELVAFAADVGAERVSLLNLEGFTSELSEQHAMNHERAMSVLSRTREAAAIHGVQLVVPSLSPRQRFCMDPWLSPRISHNGDIYPCCYVYVSSSPTWRECYGGRCLDVPQRQYLMGNIFTDSMEDIWNGKKFRNVRRSIRNSHSREKVTVEEMNERRAALDLSAPNAYCRTCLYRWSCAC
jgi:MoaA/NifB/PqqE/SkfB family radical SAM enzyme